MAASTTVDLSPVQRAIVRDALLDEFRTMAEAVAETVQYEPIEQGNMLDARWKVERMTVILALLEQIEFIEPRREKASGYAGSLFSDGQVFDADEVTP